MIPTEPGFYWARYNYDAACPYEVVDVCMENEKLVVYTFEDWDDQPLESFCDWVGPLKPPDPLTSPNATWEELGTGFVEHEPEGNDE